MMLQSVHSSACLSVCLFLILSYLLDGSVCASPLQMHLLGGSTVGTHDTLNLAVVSTRK